ncbi:TRPM8 channel-associated factor homolog [Gastrophryne carolinensis]
MAQQYQSQQETNRLLMEQYAALRETVLTKISELERSPAETGGARRAVQRVLQKMTPDNDVEAYLTVFQHVAEREQLPVAEWADAIAPFLTGKILAEEDYQFLVQGLSSLDFCGKNNPCNLLLIGDTAFPLLVSPAQHVLIAASKYGKGRIVVLSHESYLIQPQFMDFLRNAIAWLKPSLNAVVGVNSELGHLEQVLFASGHTVRKISDLEKNIGVLCTTGYDDSQAQEIVTFVREGGGLLIGAQAWHWSQCHKQDNVLCNFPGNKITSVAGIYFTGKYGEKGNYRVSGNIPLCPMHNDVDFSLAVNFLTQGFQELDISGESVPSELLLHGTLTFPIGMTRSNQCFFGAAYYGQGRVVVGTHEGYLSKPELKTLILNAILWLDLGRKGKIGVHEELGSLFNMLQSECLSCVTSDLTPGLSVYCCNSYSDAEAEKIHLFVAEGGGLLIAGHAWYWAYSNPNVLSQYPGNKILNKFGISILSRTIEPGIYSAVNPEKITSIYHFPKAVCQLLNGLRNRTELKPPLSLWLSQLRQDVSAYMKLPASPLISSLQQELVHLVQRCKLPNVSEQCPVKSCSKEALIMCLAQDVSCLDTVDDHETEDVGPLGHPPITIQIDGTNQGGDAWRSTGLYLPPGKVAVLVFPASAAGKGLQVQVGCQSDDLNEVEEFCRAPVVIRRKRVLGEKITISCIWGGLLYVIVKEKSQLGLIHVSVYGAEPAPTFIMGRTSLSSWQQTIRHYPAPWAELITENIILTVPSEAIRSLEDPQTLMSLWDEIMVAIADLAAISRKFPRSERIVADVQISDGWMHAGYPIMCHFKSANEITDVDHMRRDGLWGPVHELGHNQQKGVWEFPPHTTEATCNLWSVYVHETVLGIPRHQANPELKPDNRKTQIKTFLQHGAKLSEWDVWTALETYLQLQEGFGWDPFKQLFAEYQNIPEISDNNKDKMNLWAEKFSQAVNRNLAPFFMSWGWPIEWRTCQKLSKLPIWEDSPLKEYTYLLRPYSSGSQDQRVGLIISLLQGDPQSWAFSLSPQDPARQSVEAFFSAMKILYDDPDRGATADAKLRTLRQGRRQAEEYCSEFCRWAVDSRWNDPALCGQFRLGLSDAIKNIFVNHPSANGIEPDVSPAAILVDGHQEFEVTQILDSRFFRNSLHKQYIILTDVKDKKTYTPPSTDVTFQLMYAECAVSFMPLTLYRHQECNRKDSFSCKSGLCRSSDRNMTTKEDYHLLVQGLCSLEFSGDSVPCKLLLTGDSAFPLLVSPVKHVLLAASKYGKGRIVVMSHKSYLNEPQFMDFLKNAISWLKQSSEAVITSVAGIYFTGKYGEKGKFCVSEHLPILPTTDRVNFSEDLRHLTQGLKELDISGERVPSELLLHGPLTFPIGMTHSNQCFFGAAYYGQGRVVVGTHESYLSKPELKTFINNAISWLDMGRKGKIGVQKALRELLPMLQNAGLSCVTSDLTPGLGVYCCNSYSDAEAAEIHRFVAEGGDLLIAGHAWWWSYSNPNVLSQYPGNKILNKFGTSILSTTIEQGVYKKLDPQAMASTYHFLKAICQFLNNLKNGAEVVPPLSSWLSQLRQDVSDYMKLPDSPFISSLKQELMHLVQGCKVPTASKHCPVKSCSKEAFIMCLPHDVSCLDLLDNAVEHAKFPGQQPITVQIDGTNPGRALLIIRLVPGLK